ncbi:MAG: hypothetical protein WKG01_20435 [Kofleriaceae bacterium]
MGAPDRDGVGVAFLLLFVALPLTAVFVEALRHGVGTYFGAIVAPEALHALKLTLSPRRSPCR